MPYTNIDGRNKVQFLDTPPKALDAVGKFYPQDIAIVLAKPGVNALRVQNAIVNDVPTIVLVGVKVSYDQEGNEIPELEKTFKEVDDVVAIYCPPFNKKGGVFELTPEPAEVPA